MCICSAGEREGDGWRRGHEGLIGVYMVLRRWASQQTVGRRCSSGGSILLLWKRRITVVSAESASSLPVLPSVPANDEGATLLGLARLEMTML